MKVPGKEITAIIEAQLKKQVDELKKKNKTPHLATILIGDLAEQVSYVTKKKQIAEKLGIEFDFVHIKETPSFENFIHCLKKYSLDPKVTGIIIQQPLPAQLQTDSIYNFIPTPKEIEGHKLKSPFYTPIALATLTILKYIYVNSNLDDSVLFDSKTDLVALKKALKHKKVVMVGKGITGGRPIGKIFNLLKINYMSVNSHTVNPAEYYLKADIIVTAVGKKVILPEQLKPGVVLINIGLRREDEKLKGDYDEKDIDDIASYYTSTPGGVGPIDVLYLFKNLIETTQTQLNSV